MDDVVSAFVQSTEVKERRLATTGLVACAAVALLVAATGCGGHSATSPPSTAASSALGACPSTAVVDTTLGQHDRAPVVTKTASSKTCTYPGATRLSSTTITFQRDSASQFAVDEQDAGSFSPSVSQVNGLGQAAWTTNSGDLYVLDGHEQIKILALALGLKSPSKATAKVEALARKIV